MNETTKTEREHAPFPVGIDAVAIGYDDPESETESHGWPELEKLTFEADHHVVENIRLDERPEGQPKAANAHEWYELTVELTAGVEAEIPTDSIIRRMALVKNDGEYTNYYEMDTRPARVGGQGYTITIHGTYSISDEMRESYERGVRDGKELQEEA